MKYGQGKSRKKRNQLQLFEHNDSEYITGLPSFASTPDEIRLAVEQNALDRGQLLIKVISAQRLDHLLSLVDDLAVTLDKEDFYEAAQELNIDVRALQVLDAAQPPVAFAYYFCTPSTLMRDPRLIFYYRNVALLSLKVMRGIGLDTTLYERGSAPLDAETATALAKYFNQISSTLVIGGGVSPHRHIVLMSANLGDSLGGTSRNEVGRVAMARVIGPIIRHLYQRGYLLQFTYSTKGRLNVEEEEEGEETSTSNKKRSVLIPQDITDIDQQLEHLLAERVLYHQIMTTNGSVLHINRQVSWQKSDGAVRKLGPDLHSQVGEVDMLWAAELKGGADPAGSDEHWKTATKALDRILDAAQETGRPRPMLSFIATILVERVALEAQEWIDLGKLTSVYNLTQMQTRPEEMNRFLNDVAKFLGYEVL